MQIPKSQRPGKTIEDLGVKQTNRLAKNRYNVEPQAKRRLSLEPGTQIIYAPYHTKGNLIDEDCQMGFVISDEETGSNRNVRCRFWANGDPNRLRPLANGELVRRQELFTVQTRPQEMINEVVARLFDYGDEDLETSIDKIVKKYKTGKG